VFGIRCVSELYAKIIEDQGEHEIAVIMLPQARGNRNGGVAFRGEKSNESVVGYVGGVLDCGVSHTTNQFLYLEDVSLFYIKQ
jgi:hypothetical protein